MDSVTPEFSTPVPERRYLSILFVDLVGSTRLAELLDPEDLRVVQRRYQNLVLRIMEQYGGFVARFTGDDILVYFGYPIAHENDAERAVRAALELNERLPDLDTGFESAGVPSLSVHAGIHSGLVLVAPEMVSGRFAEHTAFGEVVNLAKRIQMEAPAAGILVSKATLDLVAGQFEHRPFATKSIRGLERPVALFQVDRLLPAATRSDTRLMRGATRLVGRQAAMARLLQRWSVTTLERRCQTVVVEGDAGIGKTRLVAEFCGRPEVSNPIVAQINCHEIFASTPLYPFASYLRARARLTVEDDQATQVSRIAALLEQFGLDGPENRELAAALLGVALGGLAGATAPTPLVFKRKQYALLKAMMVLTARAQPAVFWIEDAHWLDPSSAECMNETLAALADLPVLVLFTRRSFPKGQPLPQADETVILDGMDGRYSREIAESIPGAEALPPDTVARAVEAAEGVPLFLEQLVIALIEERRQPSLARRSGGVPLMLAEMMSERLDRRPGGRPLVQAAACIGRSFTPDFLASVLQEETSAIAQPLQSLVEAEILLPRQYGAELHYQFRHALLQRMAYESVLQGQRRVMHERIADALRDGAHLGPTPREIRAHHLTEAGRFPAAIEAWLRAGLSAAEGSAHVEAIAHLRRGLQLLDKLPDAGSRRSLELSLQAALMGSILATEGATSITLSECCARGLALCQEGEPSPLVLPFAFGQFAFTNCRGRVGEAEALAKLFLSRAERDGNQSARVIWHRTLGMVHFGQARARKAREHFELSMRLYSPERDAATTHMLGQDTQVHAKSGLSLALFCLGEVDRAIALGVDALRTADALRHPHSTAIPLAYVGGWVFGLSEAADAVLEQSNRLIALAEQHQFAPFRAHGLGNRGWAMCQHGDLRAGAAALTEAISILDGIEFRLSISGYLGNLADALRRLGDLRGAEAASARAIEMMSASSFLWLEPELRRIEALIASETSRRRGERMLREAVDCARALEFPVFERRCLLSLETCLGPDRQDGQAQARLRALADFGNLLNRVERALAA